MRWLIFSALVVVVAAVATVGSIYLIPDSSETQSFVVAERSYGPPGSAVVEGSLVYDFGVMAQATEGKHEWTIVNKGSGPITLEDGGVTCSCTHGSLKKGERVVVEPGKSFTQLVTWNTKQWTKFHQVATVLVHNDPERPKLEFVIDGAVRPPVMTFPTESRLDFLTVANDAPQSRVIGFASLDRPATKVTGVKTNAAMFQTEVKPLDPDECKQMKVEKGEKVVLSIQPGAPLGPFDEELIVTTDHPQKPEIRFTIHGKLEGPINFSPDRVRMIGVPAKQGGTQSLMLWVRGQKSTKFTVEKKPKGVDVEIEPMTAAGSASQYKLTVTIPPGLPSGSSVDDVIILKTDHPKAAEVKIPVSVFVRAS